MTRPVPLEKSLYILVPKSWSRDKRGTFLEKIAADVLRRQSFEVTERVGFTGMEVDLLAEHRPSGDKLYAEVKFHRDPVGANVVDLMVGQAFRRRITRLALFSAGPLSKGAKGAVNELHSDERVSFSFYGVEELLSALEISGAPPSIREADLAAAIGHASLVVHPDLPYLWALQELRDGTPYRLHLLASGSDSDRPTASAVREILDAGEVLEGLPIAGYWGEEDAPIAVEPAADVVSTETVGGIATAETILDYRPCRPEDFVGRLNLQKEIWDFLERVRGRDTDTRVLAVVGPSGSGKSSLVSKLSSRFRNAKWKNKLYLHPVDVRSARGPLFVAEALLDAIRSAASAGFIVPPEELSVSDLDDILSSPSISEVLDSLAEQGRVIVVFFDQFEEVFTKDELLSLFRTFKRFALDVHAKQGGLVVGFSWRTGISLSNDNPAYQVWNELRDVRATKQLGAFSTGDASALVSQFETALSAKLLPPLRRSLLEQAQGLPWLLKKLCIHVYKQIENGVSQSDLLGSRMNVGDLFDEDLDPLNEAQTSCLRYIAGHSPADSLEVYERYGTDVVDSLYRSRLVVRAGQKFAVYWDIFRDYLTQGTVPAIPWTYIPNCTVSMALAGVETIATGGPAVTIDLASRLGYSEATTVNIVTDLQNLALVTRDNDGRHSLLAGLALGEVPERVRAQFAEHVLYKKLLEEAGEGGTLLKSRGLELVRSLYSTSEVKPSTRENYLPRLVAWFEYSGLLDSDGSVLRLPERGKQGGRFGETHSRARPRGGVFLGSAPPDAALALLRRLIRSGRLSRDELAKDKLRNPALDLCTLGLAQMVDGGLRLASTIDRDDVDPESELAVAASNSRAMRILRRLMAANFSRSREDLGLELAAELGREWKPSSAKRYVNGLLGYRALAAAPAQKDEEEVGTDVL